MMMNRERELTDALNSAIQRIEWIAQCFGKSDTQIDCFDGKKLSGPEFARQTVTFVGQLRDVIGRIEESSARSYSRGAS